MEKFLFFWLRLRRAYDSAYNYTIFAFHQVISALTIYCEVLKLDQTPVNAKHIFISTVIACFKALFLFRLQTHTQSLFMCFGGERRLGVTLRRARVLMGRDEGSYFSFVPSHEILKIATGYESVPVISPLGYAPPFKSAPKTAYKDA